MNKRMIWAMLMILMESPSFADGFHSLFLSPRAVAMGNAFTAIADDESAIFYNPANLASNRRFGFRLAATSLELSDDLLTGYSTFSKFFGNFDIASLDNLIGQDYYGRSSTYSTLIGPNFGIAAIFDVQVAAQVKSLSFPHGTVGAQRTYGTQFAFGVPLFKTRKKSWDLRFGGAGKILWRSGGYENFSLTQILTLDSSTITGRLKNYGFGYGVDLGLQYSQDIAPMFTLLGGVSGTDLGDTSFTNGNDPQKSNLTSGIGLRYKAGDVKALLAYDYSHILDNWDWKLKTHLGLEFGFPLLQLEMGLNQGHFTYGAGFSFAFISVRYVHYVEDQSIISGVDPESRTLGYVALKFDL